MENEIVPVSEISLLTHVNCFIAIIISLIKVIDFANNLRIGFMAAVPYSSIKVAKYYDGIMMWFAFYWV